MKKILLVAGEVSGDHHCAELVRELKALSFDITLFGIGGDALASQGVELLFHIEDMAFLGVGEVIRHLPFIIRVQKTLVERAYQERPDCAILIDYPGFNLRMAQSLKKLGIPIIYYISPQLWAWGKRRIKKIRRYVDEMIVLFPFEKKFYEQYGVRSECVGHPLVDKHFEHLPKEMRRVNPENIVLGLLPGSRKQEVLSLLPRMVEMARLLHQKKKINKAQIVKVKHLPAEYFASCLTEDDGFIEIIEKPLEICLPQFDAAIVASGTATLETAYFGTPMLIVYHVNPLTYWLGRLLIKLNYIGLANIVAEKEIAPELIQHDFTPSRAAALVEGMLDPAENERIRHSLKIVQEKVGLPGASARAAKIVWNFLDVQK